MLYEKVADETAYPENTDGVPSTEQAEDFLRRFTVLAAATRGFTRWIKRANSIADGFSVEQIQSGFKRVFDNTTEEEQQEQLAEAQDHARRVVARRPDRRTLAGVNRSAPEAFASLAHQPRRNRARGAATATAPVDPRVVDTYNGVFLKSGFDVIRT